MQNAGEGTIPPISAAPSGVGRLPAPVSSSGRRMRLLQVQACFRHGARNPLRNLGKPQVEWEAAAPVSGLASVGCYLPGSGDRFEQNILFPPRTSSPLQGDGQPGHLTAAGMKQAVALGAELRERYIDPAASTCSDVRSDFLLPECWERASRLVAVRSTLVQRTVATAQGVLSGLFPREAAAGTMEAAIDLNGQRAVDEFTVLNESACGKLQQLFRGGWELAAANLDADQRAVIAAVEAEGGWSVESPVWKLIAYRDQWACRRSEGKAVPAHVERVAARLDAAAARQMHAMFEGGAAFVGGDADATRTESLRLGIGRLLTQMVDTLARPDGKLHLYSGHDWSVSPLLLAVSRPDDPRPRSSWPPFCSSVAFELWSGRDDDLRGAAAPRARLRDGGEVVDERAVGFWACAGRDAARDEGRYVRVLHDGRPVDMPCSGQAGGLDDGTTCRLADFRQMLAKFCVEDYAAECRTDAQKGRARAGGDAPAYNR